MADTQEKTEDPTPQKLEDARKKGDVPKSKELANFVVFMGLSIAMYFFAPTMLERILDIFRDSFRVDQVSITSIEEFSAYINTLFKRLMWIVLPLFAAVFGFGIFAYVSQFGILVTGDKIKPGLDKISPLKGIQRIFSKDTLVEFLKTLAKVSILSAIMFFLLRAEFEEILKVGAEGVEQVFLYFMRLLGKFILAMLLFLAVLGVVDFIYQRWSFQQKQKMSIKEVRDEMKQKEGDPQVKSRMRQVQRDRARARMMESVPEADVVVTNPTHVAVALQYKRREGMRAPMVVAKGAGYIAVKIKEIAASSNVPIMEKRTLARYLYRNVEVGDVIPESLYAAVAEVLAYVYRMKQRWKSMQSVGAS